MKRIIAAVFVAVVSLAFVPAPAPADLVVSDDDRPHPLQPSPEDSDKSSGCSSSIVEESADAAGETYLPHAVGVAATSVAATAGVVWLGRKPRVDES